jgi:transketolase
LSMHTVKPLDVHALAAASRETGGMVIIEEHTVDGGLGGAVAESLLEMGVPPALFVRIGLRSCFSSTVGSQHYLRKVYGLDSQAIVEAVMARWRSHFSTKT